MYFTIKDIQFSRVARLHLNNFSLHDSYISIDLDYSEEEKIKVQRAPEVRNDCDLDLDSARQDYRK